MREDEGTWLGHVMEHVALELQNVAGSDVSFGRTRSTDNPGEYNMVFQYKDEAVGREASRLSLSLLHYCTAREISSRRMRPKQEWDFAAELESFIRYAQRRELGPSTASLVQAAEERDIPWLRLNRYSLRAVRPRQIPEAHSGDDDRQHQQHRGRSGRRQGRDQRDIARPRLAGARASDWFAASAMPSVRQSELGFPSSSNRWTAIMAAVYRSICGPPRKSKLHSTKRSEHSRSVLVESYIEGYDHRMLVVDRQARGSRQTRSRPCRRRRPATRSRNSSISSTRIRAAVSAMKKC